MERHEDSSWTVHETPKSSMQVPCKLLVTPWRSHGSSIKVHEVSMQPPWNSMDFSSNLYGTPWSFHRTSMELHGVSMEPLLNSMRFHGSCMELFKDSSWTLNGYSIERPRNSTEFHGWSSMKLHGYHHNTSMELYGDSMKPVWNSFKILYGHSMKLDRVPCRFHGSP